MEGRDFDDVDVSGGGGRVPVFCFPSSLVFSGIDRDQLKQILTIYNPYDFPIRFRVLSTTPDYYNVLSPEGSINSKNCVDLIIRLTPDVPPSSLVPLESKFRVQIFNYTSRQPLGRKDVLSTIAFGSLAQHQSHSHSLDSLDSDAFHAVPGDGGGSFSGGSRVSRRHRPDPSPPFLDHPAAQPININYVAIITGIVCIIGLLLPLDKEAPSSAIPTYLHLSVNQKLLVAYTLGLVTMALFRP